jgi:hypothetical protein
VERVPVKSTAIKSVGYDPEALILQVEFGPGRVYDYHNVPAKVHAGLMAAQSKGRWIRENLYGKYKFTVPPAEPKTT